MKKILLITTLLCFGIIQAQIVDIPDYQFKQHLLNYFPTTIDTNNDNQIQVSEAEAFTGVLSYERDNYNNINFCKNECAQIYGLWTPEYDQCVIDNFCGDFYDNGGINNLTGIEAFINVTEIDFKYVNLSFNTPIDLSNFNSLEKVTLIFASEYMSPDLVTNINLSNNPTLTEIRINNDIENTYGSSDDINFGYYLEFWSIPITLNVTSSNALEKLDVNFMKLDAIDISNNINLIDLNLNNNNLTSLNIDSNTALENLNLDHNSLTSLNTNNNINLNGSLFLSFNNLTSLDVTNNLNVTNLYCTNNNLSTLDLNGLTNLERLYFGFNNLSTIDLSTNINLTILSGGRDDNLTTLDLSQNQNLTHLTFIYNDNPNFTSLDLSANNNLIVYSLYGNDNLTYINAKNGNNANATNFQFQGSPSLQSVCVDDIDSNFATEIQNDVTQPVMFSEYCSLTPATSNEITGNIKYDSNSNGCDVSDLGVPNIMVTTTNGTDSFATFTQPNGDFLLYTNEGDFTTIALQEAIYITVNPNSQTSNFVGFNNTDISDFCLEANQTINDANISIFPLTDARPGFDASYQIVFNNIGTTPLNGSVLLEFDNTKLNFLNASETVNSQTANSLTFDYANLQPFENKIIDLNFNVLAPPTTQIDDVLVFNATVNPISGDNTTTNNVFTFSQTVIGSFDPNDIQVLEGEQVLFSNADRYLHYIIRFQNTGTASAINVVVNNILDDRLDWNTLKLENTSHNSRIAITNGNDIEFIFENINLPNSTTDEINSNGFIAYKIKPKSTIALGDIITNTANIYFDFNEAIVTNTVSTEFVNTLSVQDINLVNFSIHPNPTSSLLNINSKTPVNKLEVYNNIGQQVLFQSNRNTINVSKFDAGMYFIKITGTNGVYEIKKFIKQ